jgi:hypothetical protein
VEGVEEVEVDVEGPECRYGGTKVGEGEADGMEESVASSRRF